ncbi:MAG: hypothetical protein NTY03_15730 [Candidatus Bathyarchaeota archaeon]|nr:hypothetical protein [Candidatus Bathyarchaeota archaeon]
MARKVVSGNRSRRRTTYPLELLQGRYSVARDEMLWREYNAKRACGDPDAIRHALKVLQVIRQAPD